MAQHRSSRRPGHRSHRAPRGSGRRGPALLAALVATVLVAALGPLALPAFSADRTGSDDQQSSAGSSQPATADATRASGVYPGPCQVGRARQFAASRERSNSVIVDTLDMRTFATMADPRWWTGCWGAGAPMVYGVAMIPEHSGATLSAGAVGAYDRYYLLLAQRLVAGGQGDVWLRLGWEFNGDWYGWRASGSPGTFAAYYRRIVDVMRTVSGAHFRYVWNPSLGAAAFPAERAWPGNSYVDAIGLDVYDACWAQGTYPVPSGASPAQADVRRQQAWSGYLHEDHGLNFWAGYAAEHGVPLALPEWGLVSAGLHGGGDSPTFIDSIHAWAVSHHVVFESYFDSAGDLGDHRLATYPKARAEYQRLF